MRDGVALKRVVEFEKPDLIIPEIEALAIDELVALESKGYKVVLTARAVQLTMNRQGIRRLVAETLHIPTSPYQFANTLVDYPTAIETVSLPCVVKLVMSSSVKGQSLVKTANDIQAAWDCAQEGGRVGKGWVIAEGFALKSGNLALALPCLVRIG